MQTEYAEFYSPQERVEIYTLLSAGCVVNGYQPAESGIIFFRFEDKVKCEKVLSQFLSKKLKVFAHDMVNAMRDVQAIFNNR